MEKLMERPLATGQDLIREFLRGRSKNTLRAYKRDLGDFFQVMAGEKPSGQVVKTFLDLAQPQAVAVVLQYKAILQEKGLAESTVNRRLASIKALAKYARQVGSCSWDLASIEGEKVKPYRDTRGTSSDNIKKILDQPDPETLKGKRDYSILRLFWENALRRAEVARLDIKDFMPWENRLYILGKGQGTQKEPVTISPGTRQAIESYLEARGESDPGDPPLFKNLDRAGKGSGRLTGEALYKMVKHYSKRAGLKPLSPHQIRHSAITKALDLTGGNYRAVKALSRHSKLETVAIYDDNRKDQQGELSALLAMNT